MRRILVASICLFLLVSSAYAGEKKKADFRQMKKWTDSRFIEVRELNEGSMYKSSLVDTYSIVFYDFETHDWQGWTREDKTSQVDTFFHVDDFYGLGGGDHGRLALIEGTQSCWCGVRADYNNIYTCSWEAAPGYGDNRSATLQDIATLTGGMVVDPKRAMKLEAVEADWFGTARVVTINNK